MATIVIGDVHGHSAALSDLIGKLFPELTRQDTVVFLGDYVDRGPDSRGCIDMILRFRASAPASVVTLLGNHEDWLLRTYLDHTRHSWILGMEAFETIRSYSAQAEVMLRQELERAGLRLITDRVRIPYHIFFDQMPLDHISFLRSLQPYHRSPEAVCVHGGIHPGGPDVAYQDPQDLLWGTDDFPARYQGGELVVYGHSNNAVLKGPGWPEPNAQNNTIGIDTISHGVLTAIRLPDRRIFQSGRLLR